MNLETILIIYPRARNVQLLGFHLEWNLHSKFSQLHFEWNLQCEWPQLHFGLHFADYLQNSLSRRTSRSRNRSFPLILNSQSFLGLGQRQAPQAKSVATIVTLPLSFSRGLKVIEKALIRSLCEVCGTWSTTFVSENRLLPCSVSLWEKFSSGHLSSITEVPHSSAMMIWTSLNLAKSSKLAGRCFLRWPKFAQKRLHSNW